MLTPLALAAAILAGLVAAMALRVASDAQRAIDVARHERDHAVARARLAEAALSDLRIKRSRAVSKGNRTRAAAQAMRRRAKTDEIAHATAAKRAPLEPELQFPTQPTIGETHG